MRSGGCAWRNITSRRLCCALQPSADELSDRRAHDFAESASRFADQVAQESVQLGFGGDFRQLPGQLHDFSFAEASDSYSVSPPHPLS
jgi:hypothetical protein